LYELTPLCIDRTTSLGNYMVIWLFWMTLSTLFNCLSILPALLDHDVNILFSTIKTIKWDVTN